MIKTSHKFRDMACVGEIVQLLNEITNETAEFHAFLSTFPSIQLHSVMRCGVYVCVCVFASMLPLDLPANIKNIFQRMRFFVRVYKKIVSFVGVYSKKSKSVPHRGEGLLFYWVQPFYLLFDKPNPKQTIQFEK